MIGLGSNRLTCCRRGGMSVTQAGRGGMEWLAGYREPSWASPYSAQATAALKDAFTAAQWATIRDYGFSHPEYIAAINFAAPQDPEIMYSLIAELGKTRWIISSGTQYINTGILTGAGIEVHWKMILNSLQTNSIVGARQAGGNSMVAQGVESTGWWFGFGSVSNNNISTPQINVLYEVVQNKDYVSVNGTQYAWPSGDTTAFPYTYPMYIFGRNEKNQSVSNLSRIKLAFMEIKNNGVQVGYFIPFIHKDGNNEVACMLNVVTQEMKFNLGSGSFTISETPAS